MAATDSAIFVVIACVSTHLCVHYRTCLCDGGDSVHVKLHGTPFILRPLQTCILKRMYT
jgi:hypothetical protein